MKSIRAPTTKVEVERLTIALSESPTSDSSRNWEFVDEFMLSEWSISRHLLARLKLRVCENVSEYQSIPIPIAAAASSTSISKLAAPPPCGRPLIRPAIPKIGVSQAKHVLPKQGREPSYGLFSLWRHTMLVAEYPKVS